MAALKTGTTIAGQTAWHAGNDGSGSTLDADLLDGLHKAGLTPVQISTGTPAVRATGDLLTGAGSLCTWDEAWVYPTLGNSWTNYGGGYPNARYRKTIDGAVLMDGLIAGGANGSVPFVLPVGYRPDYRMLLCSSNNDQWCCRLDVNTDGSVICYITNGNTGWYSLHVSFWVG